jgi:cell division protein FtsW
MSLDQKNHIDLALLIAVLALMLLSLGVVYSASAAWAYEKFRESERFINNHALKILLGIAALFVGVRIDYWHYKRISKPVLVLAIGLLVITLITGGEVKGASRWLRIGGFGFQPSEFAKFALLFHLCTLISTKGELVRDFKKGFLPMAFWIGSVTVLVLFQPNFSTGVMILAISLIVLLIGRIRITHMMMAGLLIVMFLVPYIMLSDYRLGRVEAFFSGDSSNAKSRYQMVQGIIGFGNGGLLGRGPGESLQRELFLPESYGDFVFSIVGEEYGFVGTMVFMALFIIILTRGLKIARFARDSLGFYLAAGVTGTITLYALVNACVTLGLLPTTGLPMPFVSYGGSSIFFSAFAVGVMLNISSHTDLHPRSAKVPVVGTVDASGEDVRLPDHSPVGRVYT